METLGSREVYANNWMRVREDAILRPDGRELAARELQEETGVRAGSMVEIGLLDVAPGLASQRP